LIAESATTGWPRASEALRQLRKQVRELKIEREILKHGHFFVWKALGGSAFRSRTHGTRPECPAHAAFVSGAEI
jgi:hypothetical protein